MKPKKKLPAKLPPKPVSKPKYEVRVLDHLALCGPGTSTRGMYLVREQYPDRPTVIHQVFVDRHGIYCANHGTECVAIREAQKHVPQLKLEKA